MNTIEIGNYIREKRELNDWKQEYLAELVDVSSKTISNWENGKTKSIKVDHLEKLAEVFNVSFWEMYNGKDMSQLDDETKKSLSILAKKLEERSFLSLDMGVFSVGLSIVALSIALGVMSPDTTLINAICFALAGLGIWFSIFGTWIIRRKAKKAQCTTKTPKQETD